MWRQIKINVGPAKNGDRSSQEMFTVAIDSERRKPVKSCAAGIRLQGC